MECRVECQAWEWITNFLIKSIAFANIVSGNAFLFAH